VKRRSVKENFSPLNSIGRMLDSYKNPMDPKKEKKRVYVVLCIHVESHIFEK